MTKNFNNRGLNFIFYDNIDDLTLFSINMRVKTFVNLNLKESLIPKKYVLKNKLNFKSSLLKSNSDAPNDAFCTVFDLLDKKENIFLGTVGLSYESIAEIFIELSQIINNKNISIFICHLRKEKLNKEIDVINNNKILLLNESEIIKILKMNLL